MFTIRPEVFIHRQQYTSCFADVSVKFSVGQSIFPQLRRRFDIDACSPEFFNHLFRNIVVSQETEFSPDGVEISPHVLNLTSNQLLLSFIGEILPQVQT